MSENEIKLVGTKGMQRQQEDRESSSERDTQQKILDQTLADSFPTSDPPSTLLDPNANQSLQTSSETNLKNLLRGLPPGSWAALSVDNTQIIGTGSTRQQAEHSALTRGHKTMSLVEVPPDSEAHLQTEEVA